MSHVTGLVERIEKRPPSGCRHLPPLPRGRTPAFNVYGRPFVREAVEGARRAEGGNS
jgi:hypothetical protein